MSLDGTTSLTLVPGTQSWNSSLDSVSHPGVFSSYRPRVSFRLELVSVRFFSLSRKEKGPEWYSNQQSAHRRTDAHSHFLFLDDSLFVAIIGARHQIHPVSSFLSPCQDWASLAPWNYVRPPELFCAMICKRTWWVLLPGRHSKSLCMLCYFPFLSAVRPQSQRWWLRWRPEVVPLPTCGVD